MKMFLALAVLLVGFGAYSQSITGNDATASQIRRGLLDNRNRSLLSFQTQKANQVSHGNVTYEGLFVQFVKSDKKLQLINPAAPPEYGSGRDNLVRDPSSPGLGSGGREGLKLFSVQF